MKKHGLVLIASLTAVLAAPSLQAQQSAPPPAAAKKPHTTRIHGYTLEDIARNRSALAKVLLIRAA